MDKELKTSFRLDDNIALRAWRETDADAALEIVLRNREHLGRFMHWMTPDYSRKHAMEFLKAGIEARERRESLGLAICEGRTLIGSIGFVSFDWNVRKTEIGYWIDSEYEGRGIITRSVILLTEYAFAELSLNRVEIRCSTQNIRSAAIPERLGFQKEGILRQAEIRNGDWHDFLIYGLLADDPRVW